MMAKEGKMEKAPKEEDLRGLEEEIESAIDRLFVEKDQGSPQGRLAEPPSTPSYTAPGEEKDQLDIDLEALLPSLSEVKNQGALRDQEPELPPVSFPEESVKDPKKEPDKKGVKAPPSPPPRSRNVLERLEAQILALEWEITEENIRKTGEQVRRLKNNFSGQREVISILGFMEKALHQMMENDESIGPSLTRFLLDAKEMLKLLTNGEEEGDQAVYRRMACEGMEAKFSLVEQLKEKKVMPPSSVDDEKEPSKGVSPIEGIERMEETLRHLSSAVDRIEATLRTMGEQVAQVRRETQVPREPISAPKPSSVHVTVFRIDERLFGVESDKIFKLFRVPGTFEQKYLHQERIRVRDFEVKLVDLKKMFALPKGDQKGETKILLVKDDEEYKGLMIGQVLKKLSVRLETGEDSGAYCSGTVHWTYQERPVVIPVLDVRKM
jgi:chemotaxis signal transduction protein